VAEPELLSEQRRYYGARAAEYDAWWQRRGRYDRGAEVNARWFAEAAALEAALGRFCPSGDILELACGTGFWTKLLAARARRLTAVDGAPEMLARARERVGDAPVEYLQADLFDWRPRAGAYDVCFFGFWLSHVPESRFEAFWEMVASALRPRGRVFFVDSVRSERSTAADHQLPSAEEETMLRRLDDGREFRIVKRFFDPRELETRLARFGWTIRVEQTGEFFIYGAGERLVGD
jgi:SAM-dependent methyltransferase